MVVMNINTADNNLCVFCVKVRPDNNNLCCRLDSRMAP